MSLKRAYLHRYHPFFSYSYYLYDYYLDEPLSIDLNDPTYFVFEVKEDFNWKDLSSILVVNDQLNILECNPELIDYLFLDFQIPDDCEDDWGLSDGYDNLHSPRIAHHKKVDHAFINAIQYLPPKKISAFLDFQFKVFKLFPNNETVENFMIYLEGLMDNFIEPQKRFVDEWIIEQRKNPWDDKLPNLPDIFKDPNYFTLLLKHEKVEDLYIYDRVGEKYRLKNKKKEMLAALALKLRDKQKLNNNIKLSNNQFLARIFLTYFNAKFDPIKGDKAFQPGNSSTQTKMSNFGFITDF